MSQVWITFVHFQFSGFRYFYDVLKLFINVDGKLSISTPFLNENRV